MISPEVQSVYDLISGRLQTGARTIIAIAGPPASGKSTLADAVVQAFNKDCKGGVPFASLLPMDGYHLDNRLLESRGMLGRKGAPDTFNSAGFCEAVRRLSTARRETFHPKFDRQMDLSIANAIAIHPETPLILVEGNYLLLKASPWASIRDAYAATIFVCPPMDVLQDRLLQRWISHGFDPDAARRRAARNDLPNAELVVRESEKADLHLSQDYKEFDMRYAY